MKTKQFEILFDKRRTCLCLLLMAAAVTGCALTDCLLHGAVFVILLLALIPSSVKPKSRFAELLGISLWLLMSAAVVFLIVQLAIDASVRPVGLYRGALNIGIILSVFLLLLFIQGKLRPAVLCGAFVSLLYATIDFYVLRFRGREITPFDVLTIRTAANVAQEYDFTPGVTLLFAWLEYLLLVILSFSLPKQKKSLGWVKRAAALACAAAIALAVSLGSGPVHAKHFGTAGAGINGTLLNFALQIKSLGNNPPDRYSAASIAALEQHAGGAAQEASHDPDVIVIMDESFADLSILGEDLRTNQPVTPFIDSLREDTVRGFALSSVYGGDTANSEYEYLTGNSMFFFPENTVPYQQYVKNESYSLASWLGRKGYYSLAMHPFLSSGWMRTQAYPLLGFDEYMFIDAFPQEEYVREYISDAEMFRTMEAKYEELTGAGNKVFLFGVTMQNHGGYKYEGEDFIHTIQLQGYQGSYPEAEQYLSLIHETDTAVEDLIDYFRGVERDVVIAFFGDHLPGLPIEFYEEIHGGAFRNTEELQKYMVPFFIWANYDIEEQEIPLSSINYLGALTFEAAGMELPPYQQLLLDWADTIPAICSKGWYSAERGCFTMRESLTSDEMTVSEQEVLRDNAILAYNSAIDTEHASTVFFAD